MIIVIGGASTATVRSSKSRFAILCVWYVQIIPTSGRKVITVAMTFDKGAREREKCGENWVVYLTEYQGRGEAR